MKIWPLLFNRISLQVNALSQSAFQLSYPFKNRRPFYGPPSTHLMPLWHFHCFHAVYHEDGISVLGTDRSQKEPYQENLWDEGIISNPHSVAGVIATCGVQAGALSCKRRTQRIRLYASFLRFPGAAASIRLYTPKEFSYTYIVHFCFGIFLKTWILNLKIFWNTLKQYFPEIHVFSETPDSELLKYES